MYFENVGILIIGNPQLAWYKLNKENRTLLLTPTEWRLTQCLLAAVSAAPYVDLLLARAKRGEFLVDVILQRKG